MPIFEDKGLGISYKKIDRIWEAFTKNNANTFLFRHKEAKNSEQKSSLII